MEEGQQKQEQSEASKQDTDQSKTTPSTQTEAKEEVKETQEHIEDAQKEVVKASETAPSNELKESLTGIADSLGRIEGSLTGLGEKVDKALPKPEAKKEHKSPEVDVDSQMKFVTIRKRGGRKVKRQVKA